MATSIEALGRTHRTFGRHIVDLSVGRKLFVGFGALTCVFALVIGCLFLTVSRLGAANSDIVEVAGARTRAADRLQFAAAELRSAQQAYVLDPTASRTEFNQ